ncbi:hypothetical protein FOZ60_003369 [Perkinsus olseni]|uniref:Secreted protein n=1 Tax=Perkinsus olseni TaxID=32597 RepID=A0A7J6PHV4_PEROL|nr:hypothetical protein FOZ60_003369 [Perkinsus olseni]
MNLLLLPLYTAGTCAYAAPTHHPNISRNTRGSISRANNVRMAAGLLPRNSLVKAVNFKHLVLLWAHCSNSSLALKWATPFFIRVDEGEDHHEDKDAAQRILKRGPNQGTLNTLIW